MFVLPVQLRREQASRRQIPEQQKGRRLSVGVAEGGCERAGRGRTRAVCATGTLFQMGAYRKQSEQEARARVGPGEGRGTETGKAKKGRSELERCSTKELESEEG